MAYWPQAKINKNKTNNVENIMDSFVNGNSPTSPSSELYQIQKINPILKPPFSDGVF
jgi:hypothetical protein